MPQTSTLSPESLARFERDGVLRLQGLAPPEAVEPARQVVLRRMEQLGLWRNGAWRLEGRPRPRWPQPGLKPGRDIGNQHPEFAALFAAPAVAGAVETLLEGRAVDRTIHPRPQVLVTLPNIDVWRRPTGWHADHPRLASGQRLGVQLFTFLEPVESQGGGTLALAGSHRLLNHGIARSGQAMRRALLREPFLQALYAEPSDDPQALPAASVGEVPLQVVEMTGAPGDVWVVDLRVLHSASPNASARPRVMLADRCLRADLMAELAAAFGWETQEEAEPASR